MSGLTLPELYNRLVFGEVLHLRFTDTKAAESFRVSLATLKSRRDKLAKETGADYYTETKLSWKYNSDTGIAEFSLKTKQLRTFEILSKLEVASLSPATSTATQPKQG